MLCFGLKIGTLRKDKDVLKKFEKLCEPYKTCSYQNTHNICQKHTLGAGSMWNIVKPFKHSMERYNRRYSGSSLISVFSITMHCFKGHSNGFVCGLLLLII